jgi:hypothetical protein
MKQREGDPLITERSREQLEFQGLGKRVVVGRFDGGAISSDGGALLLREVEARTRIIARSAGQFVDHRNPDLIEHSVRELIGQRVYALALGYADLNDHDALRHDPLIATAVGKGDPSGQDRVREQDRGKAQASSSTLNRLELAPEDADRSARYKKVRRRSRGHGLPAGGAVSRRPCGGASVHLDRSRRHR